MFIDPVAAWQCSQLAREDEHCHMDEESRLKEAWEYWESITNYQKNP